jgi:methionyl-tRNA synthetase
VVRDSEHLYFELEPQHAFLESWIPGHTTSDVSNKLLEWFREPLRGWCISRDAPYFGFEIPGHKDKYFYVWVDAPIGYLASLRNWCEGRGEKFEDWWQNPEAERYHFIGKDIIRFHCLFWPGMLNVAGFLQPDKIFVHGFLTVNGEKMSKSKGTFINARTYLDHLPPEALRYYYAAKLGPTTDDMDLNLSDFVQRVNSDLVGKITNIASRSAQMLQKRLDGRLASLDGCEEELALLETLRAGGDQVAKLYEERRFNQVVVEVCRLADAANAYFDRKEPWKSVKTDPEAARVSLTAALNAFRILAIYLKPILPAYADRAMKLFGEAEWTWDSRLDTLSGVTLGEYEYLASRIDAKQVDAMVAAATVKPADSGEVAHESRASKNKGKTPECAAASGGGQAAALPQLKAEIAFADFEKLDLRIGVVESCEIVPKSSKLLKFVLDAGPLGKRTIFSGIRMAYPEPEKLVGRQVVFVANLAPRKMSVGVSEGMILFAGEPGECGGVLSPSSSAAGGVPVT